RELPSSLLPGPRRRGPGDRVRGGQLSPGPARGKADRRGDAAMNDSVAPRLRRLRERLAELELPAALVWNPLNVGYLSGFTGTSGALIVTPERTLFVTDFRYAAQSERECPDFERVLIRSSTAYQDAIAGEIGKLGVPRIAVEGDH